uniref:Folliculin n=1 Tax=Ditylenchus dipsaci TaxID=166011 RepID=A0A915CSR6_9BILA
MLLNNYEFFLGGFSAIISRLQAMAKSFFVMEQELDDNNLRLVTNVNRTDRAQWLPHQFYPKNFVLDTSRCLSVITNNRDIFTIIHRQMLYLLKTQTTLAHDIVLEGVPSQDMLMEQNTLEENDLVTSHSTNTAPQTLLHLHNLRVIATRFAGISHSLLSMLLWQVVVGGQIVVKSDFATARKHFLLALGNLLPVGCIRLASNSSNYVHNYKANFLGCLNEICIPEEVFNEVFVIKIQPRESSTEYSEENLEDFDFFVEKCSQRDGPSRRYCFVTLNYCWIQWHQKEGIDISKIIKIIKCGTQDSPVLLFWQSGLSRRYKQVVLNTINTGKCSNRRIDFGNGQ